MPKKNLFKDFIMIFYLNIYTKYKLTNKETNKISILGQEEEITRLMSRLLLSYH